MRRFRLVATLTFLVAAAALLPRIAASRDTVREVRVTVRGMAYHVEGLASRNPELALTAGQRVRLTLKNDDAGMLHDLHIRAWGVGTGLVPGGEERVVEFRVPERAEATEYACTPHAAMMSGRVVLR